MSEVRHHILLMFSLSSLFLIIPKYLFFYLPRGEIPQSLPKGTKLMEKIIFKSKTNNFYIISPKTIRNKLGQRMLTLN